MDWLGGTPTDIPHLGEIHKRTIVLEEPFPTEQSQFSKQTDFLS